MDRNPFYRLRAALLSLTLAVAPVAAHAASFTGVGHAPGRPFSNAMGVSADGSTVTGLHDPINSDGEAFRWTAASGRQGLVGLAGGSELSAGVALSADGSVIVGISGSFDQQAFRWTASGGMQGIGGLPGFSRYSIANGVSDDGTVVVGYSRAESVGAESLYHAFRWVEGLGMQPLGTLPGKVGSRATDVSADGATVVGGASDGSGNAMSEAFRWTASGGIQGLGELPGGTFHSFAEAISGDGSVIVGQSASASASLEAFVWDAANGMRGLGFVPGRQPRSLALGVSADGTVIVGQSGMQPSLTAYVWTPEQGMRELSVVLQALGVDIGGWVLTTASDVSADGTVIVGFGYNPAGQREGWVAVIPEPTSALAVGLGLALLACRRRDLRTTSAVR